MKNEYVEMLLADEEVKTLLKEMILLKHQYLQEVLQKLLTEDEKAVLLSGEMTYEILKRFLDAFEARQEISIIERDLNTMCYALSEADTKYERKVNTGWERAYHHATKEVSIESVAQYFLGVTNFNRNVRCPFHEDKKPSLKIYTKNNRFVCFGCDARGSPIDFVIQYKNCSFKEAVSFLNII